jgi:hypothetical protein
MSTTFRVSLAVIVVVFVAAAVPWGIHQRAAANRATCIDTLRQIDGAKQQWALEHFVHRDTNTFHKYVGGHLDNGQWVFDPTVLAKTPTWADLYLYGGRGYPDWYADYPPRCPSGGKYTIGRVADAPTCSIPGHIMP